MTNQLSAAVLMLTSVAACSGDGNGSTGDTIANQQCAALETDKACADAINALQAEVDALTAQAHARYTDAECQSAVGPHGPRIIWRDATGSAGPIECSGAHGSCKFADEDNYLWSATYSPTWQEWEVHQFLASVEPWFETIDCTGPSYVQDGWRMQTFTVFGVPGSTVGRVIPATTSSQQIPLNSFLNGVSGACTAWPGVQTVVPLTEILTPTIPPAPTWVPPMYPGYSP